MEEILGHIDIFMRKYHVAMLIHNEPIHNRKMLLLSQPLLRLLDFKIVLYVSPKKYLEPITRAKKI